jgi:hypothetical protein
MTSKMDPTIKARWTTALRSGEYKQGEGTLAHGGRYCCLGVLCELAVEAGVIPKPTQVAPGTPYYYGVGDEEKRGELPESVAVWAGLLIAPDKPQGDPLIGDQTAAAWNDEEGADFNKIADLIDTHL